MPWAMMRTTYFVAEGDGIDGSQVVVVFLYQLSASCVILYNLLVAHTSQELVRFARVDSYDMRCLSGCELVKALPSLRVP